MLLALLDLLLCQSLICSQKQELLFGMLLMRPMAGLSLMDTHERQVRCRCALLKMDQGLRTLLHPLKLHIGIILQCSW